MEQWWPWTPFPTLIRRWGQEVDWGSGLSPFQPRSAVFVVHVAERGHGCNKLLLLLLLLCIMVCARLCCLCVSLALTWELRVGWSFGGSVVCRLTTQACESTWTSWCRRFVPSLLAAVH
jgi:hypothetical protein